MSRPASVAASLVLAAVGGFALTSCGTQIDDAKLQKDIAMTYARQAGIPLRSVSCPTGVRVTTGKTFTCAFTTGTGSRGVVTVTITDARGDVRWAVTTVPDDVGSATIASAIQADFKSQNARLAITSTRCPATITLSNGATADCTITLSSGDTVIATVSRDSTGGITWSYAAGK